MAINPFRRGGNDTIPVNEGGTGATDAASALSNLGGLDTSGHSAIDHSGITGAGLDLRRRLWLPEGLSYGTLNPLLEGRDTGASAGTLENMGLTGSGLFAHPNMVGLLGNLTMGRALSSFGQGPVLTSANVSDLWGFNSPTQDIEGPLRIVFGVGVPGAIGLTNGTFVAAIRSPTAANATGLIGGADPNSFAVGIAGTNVVAAPGNWCVLHGGGTRVDTGVSASNRAVIVEMKVNASREWTVAIYDAVSLATLYGPTQFAAEPVGAFNVAGKFTTGAVGVDQSEFSGLVMGPSF